MNDKKYKSQMFDDLMNFGYCIEQKKKYTWLQKLIRLIKGLPTDRELLDPRKNIINPSKINEL